MLGLGCNFSQPWLVWAFQNELASVETIPWWEIQRVGMPCDTPSLQRCRWVLGFPSYQQAVGKSYELDFQM